MPSIVRVPHPEDAFVNVSQSGTTWTVEVSGEVDLGSVDGLRRALDGAFGRAPETLVLDLSQVTFLDSMGLRAVLSAHARAREAGIRLLIVPGPDHVHRVFELCRLDRELTFVGRR